MKKNVSSQSIGAEMITAADGTAFTGTVSVLITKDNGTQTASGGTAPAHEGNGYHSYTPTQAETNADHIAFTWTGPGAIPVTIQLFTNFPQTVDNDTKISLIPTTAMRGTDSAALATSLQTVDDNVDAILIDTNDLQTNQGDWLTATGFNTVVPPSVAQFNARTILSAAYFDPAADAVANVTLVATTTANTDMRGTDSANTTTPPTTAQIWAESTRVLTAGTNLNDISVSDILTTQMTESYAADGVAPTMAQSLFLTMQNLQDFVYSGTTQTVRKIDGATTAASYTLDDAVNPTSKTRAS